MRTSRLTGPERAAATQQCRLCAASLQHSLVDVGMSPLCQSHVEPHQLEQPQTWRVAQGDARVFYHRNEQNIGAHRNYDRVLEMANGRYFKWASCSDICLPGFFEKCVAVLETRPDVALVYPRASLLFSQGPGEEIKVEYEDNLDIQQESPSVRFREYLNRERWNNVMNGLIRVSSLRQTALNLPLPGSDISMVAELALRGKFVEVPDRLFLRRFGPETTGILMDSSAKLDVSRGYPGLPGLTQKIRLHGYRFVTAWRAPIGARDKLRVWLYLGRRILWLRHQVRHKLVRVLLRR